MRVKKNWKLGDTSQIPSREEFTGLFVHYLNVCEELIHVRRESRYLKRLIADYYNEYPEIIVEVLAEREPKQNIKEILLWMNL